MSDCHQIIAQLVYSVTNTVQNLASRLLQSSAHCDMLSACRNRCHCVFKCATQTSRKKCSISHCLHLDCKQSNWVIGYGEKSLSVRLAEAGILSVQTKTSAGTDDYRFCENSDSHCGEYEDDRFYLLSTQTVSRVAQSV
jgi:hypothetical protein